MTFDRFARIFGTGRSKSAGWRQPWRDNCFVELQKRDQDRAHRRCGALAQALARAPSTYEPSLTVGLVPRTFASLRATCSTILRNSRNRSSSVEVRSDRFALITQSYRCRSGARSVVLRRNTSRKSRFARTRSTDLPIALVEAVTPSRCS